MTNENAIQVVFKPEEAHNIKELARSQRISTSAYIRAQLLAKTAPVAYGWWAHYHDRDTVEESRKVQRNAGADRMATRPPDFLLERVGLFPDGTGDFRVYLPTNEMFILPFFKATEWYQEGFDRGRVMMAGSRRLMKVVSSFADARADAQMRWLLTPDTDVPDQS